ncbi:MAG TPA: RDD family protein [Myxococcaceae bacterium]|nr:RDD family protein [Myxococcaceae bacterium]
MSRCLKCGDPLPSLGDCPACKGGQVRPRRVPTLLSQELQLDRRGTLGIDSRPPPQFPPRPPPLKRPSAQQTPPNQARPSSSLPSPSAPAEALPPGVQPVQAMPASLWRRAGATVVDLALAVGVGLGYLAIAAAVVGLKSPPSHLTGLDALMIRAHALERVLLPGLILVLVLAASYGAVFGWLWDGTTLGRRLFGIRLVDKTGQAPSPLRAILRAVLSLISFGAFLGGFWLALFDRKGQTLHDKLTSTFVVRPG